MIAVELGIPIVPAYVDGTFASLPKKGKIPRRRRINVHFGEAIDPARMAGDDQPGRLIYTEVTNELADRIKKLHDLHHGY